MPAVDPRLLADIASSAQRFYREAISPVAGRFSFPTAPTAGEISGPPTVLLLGNHSSGKSTFINFLLGAGVQKTGLAPTDDAFTILTHGAREEERDGQAVVTNPDLPYAGLRSFGAGLLSHFRLKSRPMELLREVTLVDSPGMIDAAREDSGRGYDFPGVVRWFAERADVVLMFFDPDKPGTTGETLQVFVQSLGGFDHKLLIVMNKMDRFESLQDFARAYGALCWNLGKVIPRKDLPRVYTTYVPIPGAAPPSLPAKDFDEAREEIVGEIRRAPARRADNILTQLQDHAATLLVHARVIDGASRSLRRFRLKQWGLVLLVVLFGALAGWISVQADARWWTSLSIFGAAGLLLAAGAGVANGMVRGQEKQISAALGDVFEEVYTRELLARDRADDLRGAWLRAAPWARRAVETAGLLSFPRLKRADREPLARLLETEIPALRSRLHRELGIGVAAPPAS